MRRLGRLAILLALCAGIAPRVSAQARGQATVTSQRIVTAYENNKYQQ